MNGTAMTTASLDTAAAEQPPSPALPDLIPIPTIPLALLRAHPGNVRPKEADPELVESVRADGVIIPLLITLDAEIGAVRVLDGHRRWAAAEEVGLDAVPYAYDAERAEDEAGQFLDMVTTARHRKALTPLQEAAALFTARELGATDHQLAAAAGGRKAVKAALTAARLDEATKNAATRADYEWTLTDLAALAPFEDDPDAVARLIAAAERNQFGYMVKRLQLERQQAADCAETTAKLRAKGVRVLSSQPPYDCALTQLRNAKGENLDKTNHAACPGHVATVEHRGDRAEAVYWCEAPAAHGHTLRYPSRTPTKKDPAARRLVIEGNKAWQAAVNHRREFLTGLLTRASLTKEHSEHIARFLAETLLVWPDPIQDPAPAHVHRIQADLLALASIPSRWESLTEGASSRRILQLTLAPIAACYEHAIEKRVWRTDLTEWELHARPHARRWLTFCHQVGHELSPLEAAVVDDRSATLADVLAAPARSALNDQTP